MKNVAAYREQCKAELKKVDGIEVTARPLTPYMVPGVKVDVPVMIRVKLGDFSEKMKHTEKVHVCLVLDKSGSMGGAPLNNCKIAIKNLIKNLPSESLVSLVTYDSTVQTLFTAQSPERFEHLARAVDGVLAGSLTNISDGLARAVECLVRAEEPNHKRVIFLFSDGQANEGIRDLTTLGGILKQHVKESKVVISSFGIGSNYNEEWMQAIARAGKGSYFYIKDMAAIDEIVDRGLMQVTTCVARDAVLRVRALNGHVLKDLQTRTKPDVLINGYKLHTLRSLGLYTVMATMELNPNPKLHATRNADTEQYEMVDPPAAGVSPTTAADGEPTQAGALLEYELAFAPVDPTLELQNVKNTVELTYTSDSEKLKYRDPETECHLALLDCAALDAEVDVALKRGDAREATQQKKKVLEKLREVESKDQWGLIGCAVQQAVDMIAIVDREGPSASAGKHHGKTTLYAKKALKKRSRCSWEDDESEDEEDACQLFD